MTLFQFNQMFLIVPKFEWSCFNHPNTGVFRKPAQSLIHPWALILGGRLYGANIWVEYYRTGLCTCRLTRYVQRYMVLSLNTVCSCHLTPVVGKLFHRGPDHLFNSYWRPTTFETTRTKRMTVKQQHQSLV